MLTNSGIGNLRFILEPVLLEADYGREEYFKLFLTPEAWNIWDTIYSKFRISFELL